MMLAWPLLVLGGLVFVEQDLPIQDEFGPSNSLTWLFRRADLDGDGSTDLVLPAQVCFQRNGAFPPDARAPTPGAKEHARLDCAGGVLFVRYEDRLEQIRWENGAWKTIHAQAIAWPKPIPEHNYYHLEKDQKEDGVWLERFLADLDGDGTPEIVLPGEDGLHVYRQSGQDYAEVARLDVFPPLRLARYARQSLWPPQAREIAFPARQAYCNYVIEGNRLTIVTAKSSSAKKERFTIKRYRIDPEKAFAAVPEAVPEETSEPFPWSMHAFRLNDEDPMDYVESEWEYADTSAMPVPLSKTSATTDGGKTLHTIRTQHTQARNPFVDFNGDGRVDMITWSTNVYDGGIREMVNRYLSGREVEEEINIYFQDARADFSKTPDITRRFRIRLDKPPCMGSYSYGRVMWGGRAFDIRGDFNGDGMRDIAVADRPGRLAVYLCEGNTIAREPAGFVTVPEGSYFEFDAVDVDGDGRADILLRWWDNEDDQPYSHDPHRRVYLTREGPP